MTELDELRALRETLKATIKRSTDLTEAGTPERGLGGYEKAERLRLLASMDSAILKLVTH